MKVKKMAVFLSLGILASLTSTDLVFAMQTVFPTGTTLYNPDEAYSSYILISDHSAVGSHASAKVREAGARTIPDDVRLIDMNGNVVHVWKVAAFFNKRSRLLPNGNAFRAEENKGRLFQVKPDDEIVWEYVNRGGTTRPSVIPYDYTPQLRARPKPEERAVTPPNNLEWHIKPDKFRKKGEF